MNPTVNVSKKYLDAQPGQNEIDLTLTYVMGKNRNAALMEPGTGRVTLRRAKQDKYNRPTYEIYVYDYAKQREDSWYLGDLEFIVEKANEMETQWGNGEPSVTYEVAP